MKKIININFHGRVVPIEETAYEILQQYVESLRGYFANEEGRDEIINDIENRFAELFSESLKKGSTCITDADVNTIIASMGRPEDFEQEDMAAGSPTNGGSAKSANTTGATGSSGGSGASGGSQTGGQGYGSQQSGYTGTTEEPRRLYRAENDKILGGVCAGLANYLRLDPAIVRIIFALITLGGFGLGFILYIILWVVLPTKSLEANVRKRLYRNPDHRVIGGVASGLAAYFHIEVWIPRLIFLAPLILGIFASIFRHVWFWWDHTSSYVLTGGFGGSLFITYIILWMVLPEASTASEKLEMRGEKVDLESIKNSIKSDLESFSKKAKEMGAQMGTQIGNRFQQAGEDFKSGSRQFASEAGPAAQKVGQGIGHAIGVVFKAFFLFIAGTICFALIMVLIGLIFSGTGVLAVKDYILTGFWQNFLAWSAFGLFLVIPVVALLTWLIRRIIGARSRSHYLGYIFAGLWVIGLFCFIAVAGMVMNNYRYRQQVQDDITLTQPARGKMIVKTNVPTFRYADDDNWFDFGWERHGIYYTVGEDSIMLNTVRVDLFKSPDSNYHVQVIRSSRGASTSEAHDLATQVSFTPRQADSVLTLPYGFAVRRDQRFRNQQVLVAVAIPVGHRILIDRSVTNYDWFNMNFTRRRFHWVDRWDRRWSDDDWSTNGELQSDWGTSYPWNSNREYVMTDGGLQRTDKEGVNDDEGDSQRDGYKDKRKNKERGTDQRGGQDPGEYRYHRKPDSTHTRTGKDTGASHEVTMNDANPSLLLTMLF